MRTRAAYFGIFTALALILGYVELLIPIHFGIPGAKLGLANLITILVLYKMGWKEAFLLSVARVVLGGFIFSNLFSILYRGNTKNQGLTYGSNDVRLKIEKRSNNIRLKGG